jgi:hypothetical protein
MVIGFIVITNWTQENCHDLNLMLMTKAKAWKGED